MLTSIRSAISRASERAAAKRAYRFLQGQSDHLLKDIGLTRDSVYGAVVRGPRPALSRAAKPLPPPDPADRPPLSRGGLFLVRRPGLALGRAA